MNAIFSHVSLVETRRLLSSCLHSDFPYLT